MFIPHYGCGSNSERLCHRPPCHCSASPGHGKSPETGSVRVSQLPGLSRSASSVATATSLTTNMSARRRVDSLRVVRRLTTPVTPSRTAMSRRKPVLGLEMGDCMDRSPLGDRYVGERDFTCFT